MFALKFTLQVVKATYLIGEVSYLMLSPLLSCRHVLPFLQ